MLAKLVEKKAAWALLFGSCLSLELAALYFQYGMQLAPCIMCIYQRTAVIGIMFSAIPPLIYNIMVTRFIAYITWGVSTIWGLIIAIEHVDIQTAVNPFFASCEFVPNFPSWAPLHEWLPAIFEASGDCGDIDWQFMDMSMPQWMIVVFAIYSGIFGLVLLTRLWLKKRL
ncbi:disulfide bond formation protein DsbB [Paraglaciecola aquimarina]|uniref:Disulfide bond formation protein B n=1 Tax=Paraglaciecola algarum TaxID=3050085 RepID=A0ABS9D1X0_9ALTE|nr:disulfide bond formation protein DsbB [Paraglaciecola sp. G1-23]MCF2946624.1 disulfide bond formation protein DsbB [Paraglaciecola sp. G1-23]